MNPETVTSLARSDRTLAALIKKVGPVTLKPRRRQPPFEALVEAVVYQQLHAKAAATILGRVKGLYPEKRFPTPDDLIGTPDEDFRSAGLSRAKTLAIKDIAAKTADGTVPTSRLISRMSDEEIIERLTTIRGVGRWTAEMLLIFKLGRPDVLPTTDYGVRKGFALVYRRKELPTPNELAAFGERWKPFRTTAAWYFWRALELPSQERHRD